VSLPRFHRLVFLVAVLVYLVTAWNSTGYHSADEHFQIIAFAQWKVGELAVEHLAWEFDAGIRSSFQPWIAVGVFRCAEACGISDPFTRTLLLRLLTAAFALIAVRGFARVTSATMDAKLQKPYLAIAYLLWFLPFLHVRFSSESWSGLFLLVMFTTILKRGNGWAFKAGIIAGLAMLCRPPTGLIVLSAVAWMMTMRKDHLRSMLSLGLGALVVLLLGALLDSAFYGSFTPTTWNYVHMGFAGDAGHRFDELPWYYYPPWIVKYAIPPIGALILLAFVVMVLKRPKHLVVWCAVPYVLVHSFIGHKELRFLYPLADLVPWLLISAWAVIQGTSWEKVPRAVMLGLTGILLVANLVGLSVVMTTSAGEGRVRLAEALHPLCKPGDRVGYVIDPAIAWRIVLPDFHRPKGTNEVIIDPRMPYDQLEPVDFIVLQDGVPVPFGEGGFELIALERSEPFWSTHLMRWYTWNEGPLPWTLYRTDHSVR